jgi:hypothetical protein
MQRRWGALGLAVCGALVLLRPAPSAADGALGSTGDRLDWPGTATDRYLDGEEITAVLHAAAEAFAGCAAPEVLRDEGEAPLWLRFGVDPQGRAAAGQLEGPGATSEPAKCLLDVLAGLKFGDHDGLPGRYSYPLILQRHEDGVRNLPYPVVLVAQTELRLPLLSLPLDINPEDLAAIEASLAPKQP